MKIKLDKMPKDIFIYRDGTISFDEYNVANGSQFLRVPCPALIANPFTWKTRVGKSLMTFVYRAKLDDDYGPLPRIWTEQG